MVFHEKGPWWAEENWKRLHEAYQSRINRFRLARRSGKRLYIFCIAGACNVDTLIDAFESQLDDNDARLLIINVLKEEQDISIHSPRIRIRHIPFPEDYNWNDWVDYEGDRGHIFELEIVRTIREQLADLKDYRTDVFRFKNAVQQMFAPFMQWKFFQR